MEANGDSCRDVVVWSSLKAGKNGFVYFFSHLRIFDKAWPCHHEEGAAGAAECFMGRCHEDVCVKRGTRVDSPNDETGNMGDICQEVGSDAVYNCSPLLPVKNPGIRGGADDNYFRFFFFGKGGHVIHVNETVSIDVILN